jgi:hypothetical protein
MAKIYQFFRLNLLQLKELISNHSQNCLNRTKTQIEKFNNYNNKQKEEIIPMNTVIMTTMITPLDSSNQTTLTDLLSTSQNRS